MAIVFLLSVLNTTGQLVLSASASTPPGVPAGFARLFTQSQFNWGSTTVNITSTDSVYFGAGSPGGGAFDWGGHGTSAFEFFTPDAIVVFVGTGGAITARADAWGAVMPARPGSNGYAFDATAFGTNTTFSLRANTATPFVLTAIEVWGPSDVPLTNLDITPSSMSVQVGATRQLSPVFTPAHTSQTDITWSVTASNPPGAASVSQNGLVTGVMEGTATVQVVGAGGRTATASITITSSDSGNPTTYVTLPLGFNNDFTLAGIPGGIPNATIVHTTLNAGATRAQVQTAIDAASAAALGAVGGDTATRAMRLQPQHVRVVQLGAGLFNFDATTVNMRPGVVLRGAVDANGDPATVIRAHTGSHVFMIGTMGNRPGGANGISSPAGTFRNLAAAASAGDTYIRVAAGHGFSAGQILMIDRNLNTTLQGNGEWSNGHNQFTRSGRQAMQFVEVASVDTSVTPHRIHLTNRVNLHFPLAQNPQVYNTDAHNFKFMGLENLRLEITDTNPSNTGRPASIEIGARSSYSWVRNIWSDGTAHHTANNVFTGPHIQMDGFRNHVTGSFIHNSSANTWGGSGYGIRYRGTDGVIDNNVVDFLNKSIIGQPTGGGNVIAHNFVPNAVISDDWSPTFGGALAHPGAGNPPRRNQAISQRIESAINMSHGGYSHSDLFEGNITSNLCTDGTSANGWFTIFRNHSWGRNWGGFGTANTANGLWEFGPGHWGYHNEIGSIRIAGAQGPHVSIGNVFGSRGSNLGGLGPVVNPYFHGTNALGSGLSAAAARQFGQDRRFNAHDFSYGTAGLLTRAATGGTAFNGWIPNWVPPSTNLPNSLFFTQAPDYFAGYVWPPIDAFGAHETERVGALPAEDRWRRFNSGITLNTGAQTGAVNAGTAGTVSYSLNTVINNSRAATGITATGSRTVLVHGLPAGVSIQGATAAEPGMHNIQFNNNAATLILNVGANVPAGTYTLRVSVVGRNSTTNSNGGTFARITPTVPVTLVVGQGNVHVSTYAVNITGGTANPSGPNAASTSVTITAGSPPVAGQVFDGWNVTAPAGGLTFTAGGLDTSSATFTMPSGIVTVAATWRDAPLYDPLQDFTFVSAWSGNFTSNTIDTPSGNSWLFGINVGAGAGSTQATLNAAGQTAIAEADYLVVEWSGIPHVESSGMLNSIEILDGGWGMHGTVLPIPALSTHVAPNGAGRTVYSAQELWNALQTTPGHWLMLTIHTQADLGRGHNVTITNLSFATAPAATSTVIFGPWNNFSTDINRASGHSGPIIPGGTTPTGDWGISWLSSTTMGGRDNVLTVNRPTTGQQNQFWQGGAMLSLDNHLPTLVDGEYTLTFDLHVPAGSLDGDQLQRLMVTDDNSWVTITGGTLSNDGGTTVAPLMRDRNIGGPHANAWALFIPLAPGSWQTVTVHFTVDFAGSVDNEGISIGLLPDPVNPGHPNHTGIGNEAQGRAWVNWGITNITLRGPALST